MNGGFPPFADDPLAQAVYCWVAYCTDGVEKGDCAELERRFDELAEPAPTLWRGLDARWKVPSSGWAVENGGPWAATSARREYAELWSEGVLLEIRGAVGVSLVGLLDRHPGFPAPVTDEDYARLHFMDNDLYDRVHSEQEWLVCGSFNVVDVQPGLIVVRNNASA